MTHKINGSSAKIPPSFYTSVTDPNLSLGGIDSIWKKKTTPSQAATSTVKPVVPSTIPASGQTVTSGSTSTTIPTTPMDMAAMDKQLAELENKCKDLTPSSTAATSAEIDPCTGKPVNKVNGDSADGGKIKQEFDEAVKKGDMAREIELNNKYAAAAGDNAATAKPEVAGSANFRFSLLSKKDNSEAYDQAVHQFAEHSMPAFFKQNNISNPIQQQNLIKMDEAQVKKEDANGDGEDTLAEQMAARK